MQFYRRWYNCDELRLEFDTNIITDTLSKWGFVELDGSPLKKTYSGFYGRTGALQCRWRYNTDTRTCFTFGSFSNNNAANRMLHYITKNFSGDKICTWPTDSSSVYTNITFIPLKNRGFIILSYAERGNSPSNHNNPPVLAPYMTINGGSGGWDLVNGCFMFYNNVNNSFNLGYSHYTATNVSDSSAYGFDSGDWNFNNYLWSAGTSMNAWDYRYDYKANICTLIKHPYSNGFLSNLFLITTSSLPLVAGGFNIRHTGLWGKFFSFGGRNFYCPAANLAVELPSN